MSLGSLRRLGLVLHAAVVVIIVVFVAVVSAHASGSAVRVPLGIGLIAAEVAATLTGLAYAIRAGWRQAQAVAILEAVTAATLLIWGISAWAEAGQDTTAVIFDPEALAAVLSVPLCVAAGIALALVPLDRPAAGPLDVQ